MTWTLHVANNKATPAARVDAERKLHLNSSAFDLLHSATHVCVYTDEASRIALVVADDKKPEALKLVSNGSGGRYLNLRTLLTKLGYEYRQVFDAAQDGEFVVLTPREVQP